MISVKSTIKAEKSAAPVSEASEKEPKDSEFTALLNGLFAAPPLLPLPPNNLSPAPQHEQPSAVTDESAANINPEVSENTNAIGTAELGVLPNAAPRNLSIEINNFLPAPTKSKIDLLSGFKLDGELTPENLPADLSDKKIGAAKKEDSLWPEGPETGLAETPFEILTGESAVKTPEKNIFSDTGLCEPAFALNTEKPESADKWAKFFTETGGLLEVHNPNLSKENSISETAAAPPAAAAEKAFIEQIEPRVLELAGLTMRTNEKQILKMRLHPAELGMVEIKIEKNKNGRITANFQTESEEAGQILTENIEQLRDSLEKAGWPVDQLEISSDASAASSNGSSAADRDNNSRSIETNETDAIKANSFDGNSNNKDDLKENQINRLLSVRA